MVSSASSAPSPDAPDPDSLAPLLDATARAEHDHFWFRGFRRFVRPLLHQALADCERPQILDCGCGTGANLEMLAALGDAYGFDREWTGVTRAVEAGRHACQGTVAALPFPDARFDLLTSFDVLYCLETPVEQAAVSEMFRVVRPGGHVVINVAAMPILTGNHSVLGHELRRYTAPSMRRLLSGAGFSVERLTYTNASMLPILLPLRLAQRAKGLAKEEDATGEITVPPRPVNYLLAQVLALEAALVRWVDMPCGSSLLALARRPG